VEANISTKNFLHADAKAKQSIFSESWCRAAEDNRYSNSEKLDICWISLPNSSVFQTPKNSYHLTILGDINPDRKFHHLRQTA
jgi:hypothetical protein